MEIVIVLYKEKNGYSAFREDVGHSSFSFGRSMEEALGDLAREGWIDVSNVDAYSGLDGFKVELSNNKNVDRKSVV